MLSPFVWEPLPTESAESSASDVFAADVQAGLSGRPRMLPPKYLYDAVGSALFDAITAMPEYGLTRADERLLHRHADEIARQCRPRLVVELGSGSGRKTRPLLEAILGRQPDVAYCAIDVSASALERCRRELSGMAGLAIETREQNYLDGLRSIALQRVDSRPLLALFLGSSIGNFDREEAGEFLSQIRQSLQPGDALLIGADLVKPAKQLLLAYDDPTGVTAAFNKNLLARINRELEGDFDLYAFHHKARWNSEERRIEMHLRACHDSRVRIRQANYEGYFLAGETIWTESSYKFESDELITLARQAGFSPHRQWIDTQWPFAECLWVVS
jgi:L-histidine Nalpha-methyltransferase